MYQTIYKPIKKRNDGKESQPFEFSLDNSYHRMDDITGITTSNYHRTKDIIGGLYYNDFQRVD